MKKILSMLFIIPLALMLVGCENSKKEKKEKDKNTTTTRKVEAFNILANINDDTTAKRLDVVEAQKTSMYEVSLLEENINCNSYIVYYKLIIPEEDTYYFANIVRVYSSFNATFLDTCYNNYQVKFITGNINDTLSIQMLADSRLKTIGSVELYGLEKIS